MDKITICINAFLAGVTIWIIRKYLNSILQKKEKAGILNLLLWGCYFIYQLLLETNGDGPIYLVAINIILIFLICHTGYYGAVRTKILYIVLLCVVWSIIEIVAFYCLQNIFQTDTFIFHSFGSMFSKLISVILVSILGSRFEEGGKKNLPFKYVNMLLVVSIAGILIAYNIFLIDTTGKNVLTMISFSLLLFMNCMIFEIYQKLYTNMETERKNTIFEQQLKMISTHLDEQTQMRQELREFRHNLANYCVGLKAKIAGGEYDEALSMIDDMLDKGMNSKNMIINCGNDLIDSLINYKYGIAQKYKIEFQTEILVPEKLAVDYGDLAIILGDLIDNAIEAAKECKEERKIEISMGVKKEELVIVIRNTCAKEPLTDKQGNFMTTKKNAEEHGIGLYSVKKVVKKYEGNTSFQVKDGWFEAIIVVGMLQIVSCPYKSEMLR